jgi:hypothetical protein
MHYKTITLELLQDQYPILHERLKKERTLIQALEFYARGLKASHEVQKVLLAQTRPGSNPAQISSEALELAIEELKEALSSAMPPDDDSAETLSLDAAMTFLRRHTPTD